MDPATMLFLQRKLSQFESTCSGSLARIRTASTLADVVRAMAVHPDVLIRHLGEVPRLRVKVAQAAEARATTFVDDLVKRLTAEGALDEKVKLAREVAATLRLLQGNFPRQYVNLDRTAKKVFRAPAAPTDPLAPPVATPADPE